MARENASLVYPEGKLFICRSLTGPGWEVRSASGVDVTKVPTEKGGSRTVNLRRPGADGTEPTFLDDGTEQTPAVLQTGISKGIDARLAAVDHQVRLGLMTEEQGAAQKLALKPPKAAK